MGDVCVPIPEQVRWPPGVAVAEVRRGLNAFVAKVDIIVSGDVIDELWSTYSEELHACLGSEACMLWRTDQELSFGLVIADGETMCLGVYDESMRLFGTVANGLDDAVEWVLKTFHEYRDASDEVFLRGTVQIRNQAVTVRLRPPRKPPTGRPLPVPPGGGLHNPPPLI